MNGLHLQPLQSNSMKQFSNVFGHSGESIGFFNFWLPPSTTFNRNSGVTTERNDGKTGTQRVASSQSGKLAPFENHHWTLRSDQFSIAFSFLNIHLGKFLKGMSERMSDKKCHSVNERHKTDRMPDKCMEKYHKLS